MVHRVAGVPSVMSPYLFSVLGLRVLVCGAQLTPREKYMLLIHGRCVKCIGGTTYAWQNDQRKCSNSSTDPKSDNRVLDVATIDSSVKTSL